MKDRFSGQKMLVCQFSKKKEREKKGAVFVKKYIQKYKHNYQRVRGNEL